MINSFINMYPISKTIRFALLPVGKTEENFSNMLLLQEDEKRADEYQKVKKIIDRFHRYYIESVLNSLVVDGVKDYAKLYYQNGKDDKQLALMERSEVLMRKAIAKALTSTPVYKSLFSKELISDLLPGFLSEKEELESVAMFKGFFTYFTGFNDNRKNMYTAEPQPTAIAYRCINENLPKFLDNAANFVKIAEALPAELETLNADCGGVYGVNATDVFSVDYFSFVLSQSGIDRYNGIIGGYTCEDGTKVQGLNEYINLYNQQVAKKDKSLRLPFMKPLYKQILTEGVGVSFIPEKFSSDSEVLSAVKDFYDSIAPSALNGLKELFSELESFDANGIFVRTGVELTGISNKVFGKWSAVSEGWTADYTAQNPPKRIKNEEEYLEGLKAKYNKIQSLSIADVQRYGEPYTAEEHTADVVGYFKNAVAEKITAINDAYKSAEQLLTEDYSKFSSKKLCTNEAAVELLKALLDAVKELERTVKPLLGSGKEDTKDDVFYGEFLPLYESVASVDRLYDKVRNYATQKPYSKDKIKLNFQNPQLLGGWDRNKESDYRTVILRKDGQYYLAVMDKSSSKAFVDCPYTEGEDCYEKMEYKLLPGPNKMLPKVFFAASNIDYFAPDKEILRIRKEETFKKGDNFSLKDCHKLIDFFKASINKHEDWAKFGFKFTPTEQYKDISEFYNEVKEQGYSLTFNKVSESYINELVESGQLYLFKLHNKDFSEHSKGKPNLHTLYFKMLFDEQNLKDVVYQLNGGAEMFYRKPSIKREEAVIHPANQPLANKNGLNPKRESIFKYDIIKDRRFTKRQFSLHVPITLNFKAKGFNFINNEVRRELKHSGERHIIGIDRGERNLLYISVINGRGELVEQRSLNTICSDNGYKVDYHTLLDKKEKERDTARKSWGTVENIKELKEGYLSQVVHEICQLVLKYDAVIAMEDLNSGFKNSRFKVEKQVYQKFENMLISKLNFLVDKATAPDRNGGLLRAYQLTNKVDGVNRGRQNGIIFYVPAWLTSKIDPVTGFADLLKPRYTSMSEARSLFEKLDRIEYDPSEDMFEFDIDLLKFPKTAASARKQWTVCTNSERIETFINPQKNNEWDNRTVVLTEEFKALFEEYGIDYRKDLKQSLLSVDKADFWRRLVKLFGLTLQMRNSEAGNTEVDYLISPVRDANGEFFDSRKQKDGLPKDADANGAFNIARKALWAIDVLKNTADQDLKTANLSITNAAWLEYVQ